MFGGNILRIDLPIIKIGSLRLREIRRDDYYDYFLIGKDEITCKNLNWGPFNNQQEALYVIDEIILKRPYYRLPIGYAITLNETMIGIIDYHTYNPNNNSCEIGYILSKDYWGLGIMTKCLKAIIRVGFNHLLVDKLILGHSINNKASKRVIEKCGFHYEYEQMVQMKDNYELGFYYSLYRYEWKGN